MIKLVSTVIDDKLNLIGFVGKGKASDFGGIGSEETFSALTIGQLAQKKFKNNQIIVRPNGVIEENGYFKIYSLPMKQYIDHQLKDVPSTIKLLAQVRQNNKVGGYDTELLNEKRRIETRSIIRLSRYFKPVNFMVRTNSSGKEILAGNNGTRISDLPVVDIGAPTRISGKNVVSNKKKENTTKTVNEHGVSLSEPRSEKLEPQVGLIDLYTAIQSNNGFIILFPEDKCQRTTKAYTEESNEFIPMNIGEIAKLDGNSFIFNKTELNASATFKQPGTVMLPSGMNITTFTLKAKKLINNGKNHIKRIGIGIPDCNGVKTVLNLIGDPARVKEVDNDRQVNTFRMLSGCSNLRVFTMDISDVPLVMEQNLERYVLNSSDLNDTVRNLSSWEFANKFLRAGTGLCGELSKELGKVESAKIAGKTVCKQFSGYKKDVLKEMQECGIDIFTGAYTLVKKVEDVQTDNSDKDTSDTVDKAKELIIKIRYYLKGFDLDKWSYSKIKAEYNSESCSIPGLSVVGGILHMINSGAEKSDIYRSALNIAKQTESMVESLRKKVWLHKYCMYKIGNALEIHSNDSDEWLPVKSRKKTGAVYENSNFNGLILDIDGIDIA